MKLFIFKHRGIWWAAIVDTYGWSPAAAFLTWDSALSEGRKKLKVEARRRAEVARLRKMMGAA